MFYLSVILKENCDKQNSYNNNRILIKKMLTVFHYSCVYCVFLHNSNEDGVLNSHENNIKCKHPLMALKYTFFMQFSLTRVVLMLMTDFLKLTFYIGLLFWK